MKRRLLSLALCGALLCGALAGCGGNETPSTSQEPSSGQTEDEPKILTTAVSAELNTLYPLNMDVQNNIGTKLCDDLKSLWKLSEKTLSAIIEYIYEHFDVFRLLLMRAEGTRYSSFLDDVVCLETQVTLKFFAELRSRGIQVRELAEEEWHILLHSYFASLAEVVMHNFPKEAALKYAHTLVSFFNSGWQTILGI